MLVFLSASETHNRKNVNRPVADSLAAIERMLPRIKDAGLRPMASIATSFGCPYEGHVPQDRVARPRRAHGRRRRARRSASATPPAWPTRARCARSTRRRSERLPGVELTAHFHNTRGQGLANALAALDEGIESFESSFGELGGCPVPPGSTGNIATEDLVSMLHEMGFETGDRPRSAARREPRRPGRPRPAARQPRPDGRTGDVGRCLTSTPSSASSATATTSPRSCCSRPPANALGLPLIEGLEAALEATRDAKLLVVAQRIPGFFAAGADIKHMATVDADEFAAYGDALRTLLNRFAAPERISIAAVDGLALGGGLELALACTLRIGTEPAPFGLPEVKLGLIPGAGGTQRLPRLDRPQPRARPDAHRSRRSTRRRRSRSA